MEKIFVHLLNMSITAGWIVLALVILRPLIKKLPKWVGCTLWALVGIRLLLPFSFESVLSLIPSVETIPPDIAMQRNPEVHTGIEALNHVVNPVITQSFAPKPDVLTSVNPLQVVEFVMANVWVVGIIVMLLYAVISFIALKLKLRTATLLEKGIYESELVATPFILGKTVYLPYHLSKEEKEYCIMHERAHLKRGDHLIKPFAFLLLSVYWFNPLMWLAFVLLCRDIELACDEKVVKELGEAQRREYSLALVKNSVERKRITACPLAFGEIGVKERVKKVMNYKKPAFWVVVVAVALSIVLTVCLLTNPAGMRITGIEEHSKMLDDVVAVEFISDGNSGTVYDTEDIRSTLKKLRVDKYPVSQSRSETRDSTNRLVIRYGDSNPTMLCFNADCTELWLDNGVKPTYSYEVKNPEKVKALFDKYLGTKNTPPITVLSSGSDLDGVSVSIKNYDFGENPYIEIEWKNDTDNELVIGEYFDLLYSNGMGNSFSCAKGDVVFHDIAYIIPAHNSTVMTYDLSSFDVSKSGYYTFQANFNGHFWIDFIVDYGGFYQDDIIEIQPIENENLTKLYQAGNALSPISSMRFAPIFRIDSKEEFISFAEEYDFIRPKDGGFLKLIAEHCDETIFENYSFFIAVVTSSPKVSVGEFYVDEKEMRLSLVTNERFPEEVSDWLIITAKPKSELSNARPSAVLVYEPKNTTYTYYFSPDPFPPKLVLYEDGTGSFSYSALSSYMVYGPYTNDGEKIVLTTSDNRFHYTFRIDGEKLIFDAENSSEIPKYRYSENEAPKTPVPDGAVFE